MAAHPSSIGRGFELEAGAVTLAEIQDRAASFDPLTLRPDEDVRAISGNAWFSLGRHGLGLHFQRAAGRVNEVLILRRPGRGKVWEVVMDDKAMERFGRIEEAVDAVDFEIHRMGRAAAHSATDGAGWRRAAASPPRPGEDLDRLPADRGEALRLSGVASPPPATRGPT